MLYQIYMFGACMNGFTHSFLVAWTVFSKVLGGYTQPHSSVGPSAPNAWTHAACSSLQHLKGSPARRDVTSSCLTDMPICTTFSTTTTIKKQTTTNNHKPQTTNNKTPLPPQPQKQQPQQQTTNNNKQQPTNNNEPPPPASPSPSSTTTATTTTVTKCKWKRANSDVCNKHGLHWPTTQERCGAIGGWTGGVRRHSHSFCYNVVRSHSAFSP